MDVLLCEWVSELQCGLCVGSLGCSSCGVTGEGGKREGERRREGVRKEERERESIGCLISQVLSEAIVWSTTGKPSSWVQRSLTVLSLLYGRGSKYNVPGSWAPPPVMCLTLSHQGA